MSPVCIAYTRIPSLHHHHHHHNHKHRRRRFYWWQYFIWKIQRRQHGDERTTIELTEVLASLSSADTITMAQTRQSNSCGLRNEIIRHLIMTYGMKSIKYLLHDINLCRHFRSQSVTKHFQFTSQRWAKWADATRHIWLYLHTHTRTHTLAQ